MKIILTHPTANNFTRSIANKFVEEKLLHKFYTCVAIFPGSFLDRISFINFLSEIRRRRFDAQLKPFTRSLPWYELIRQVASKLGFKGLVRHETGPFCIDAVYQKLDQYVATKLEKSSKQGAKSVYSYEDGALATFIEAKKNGLICIYDLPIAHWQTTRRLLTIEAERLPLWADTLGGGIRDSPQKLARKDQELALADTVIVPSQFVMDSLPVWAQSKQIVIAPFGTPSSKNGNKQKDWNSAAKRPLRVLFAGSMGQRKGLGDLFAAVKLLNTSAIELVVMGSLLAPMEFYRSELPTFTYEPGRPNDQVLQLMQSCDVLCLPSIIEGRALVMQEAMSQGLPLIITPNTGGGDLIVEGKTGFLVPICSPNIIAEKLTWFLENRSEIPVMSRLAQVHSETYTWDLYGKKIVGAIANF